jgi:outer membrane protein
MIRALLVFLTCNIFLHAQELYSVRLAGGIADSNDLGQILSSQIDPHDTDVSVIGIDGGYLLKSFDAPFDIYIKAGLNRFLENGYQDDFFEMTLYVKLYYNLDFYSQRVRFGVAEGGSYAFEIPIVEQIEAQENDDHNSNFLNYLEFSVDFDIGRLLHVKALKNTYLGYTLKHRSGIYGLINNVERGGSNYNLLHIETNF